MSTYPTRIARIALAAMALTLFACGGTDIGESCESVGSPDECVNDALCTNEADGSARCRIICADTADCPDAHTCNGVSGTSTKSCQPD